jgi:hypothetical protein
MMAQMLFLEEPLNRSRENQKTHFESQKQDRQNNWPWRSSERRPSSTNPSVIGHWFEEMGLKIMQLARAGKWKGP